MKLSFLKQAQKSATLKALEYLVRNRYSGQLKKAVMPSNIRKPASCHTFRHSFTTYLFERGADIRKMQAQRGIAVSVQQRFTLLC